MAAAIRLLGDIYSEALDDYLLLSCFRELSPVLASDLHPNLGMAACNDIIRVARARWVQQKQLRTASASSFFQMEIAGGENKLYSGGIRGN